MPRPIAKPPRPLSAYRFLSLGATGWVYQIDDDIVLKYARAERSEAFARESKTYDIFEKHNPCPYVVQSFLRLPNANFLAFLSGGSLEKRLRANQRRNERNEFLGVLKTEPIQTIERWVMDLCGAVAWIESLGLVHGDLRPDNLLIDGVDHLKLVDFDCAGKIGTESRGSPPPWARLLGQEAGIKKGTWGINGPQTEQFAIGSIIYTITRGHEPYEDQERGPDIVRRLQNMDFPELGDSCLDTIIDQCWRTVYESVESLAKNTAGLSGAIHLPRATALEDRYVAEKRTRCKSLVDDGLLQKTGMK
jgi:serine/threonine protein kinase